MKRQKMDRSAFMTPASFRAAFWKAMGRRPRARARTRPRLDRIAVVRAAP